MQSFQFLLLFTTYQFQSTVNSAKSKNVDDIIPENYSVSRPKTSDPIVFVWKTDPYMIPSISPKHMEFSIDIEINAFWIDTELELGENDGGILPKPIAAKLWYPWINFVNCKGCDQSIIDYNKQNFEVYKKGINIIFRNTYTFSCIFDLKYYPFDEQKCEIKVRLSKWNGPIHLNLTEEIENYENKYKYNLTIPAEYKLINIKIITTENNADQMSFNYIFSLERISISQVLLIFLPSILIVVLSWISFWLDASQGAPRVALGLTTLLTLATQFNSAQKDLPAMSTVKALDVWMFSCMFMVFGSLIEFAMAYKYNQEKLKRVKTTTVIAYTKPIERKLSIRKMKNICGRMKTLICQKKDVEVECKTNIDDISKVLFPMGFLIFNLWFWNYYLL